MSEKVLYLQIWRVWLPQSQLFHLAIWIRIPSSRIVLPLPTFLLEHFTPKSLTGVVTISLITCHVGGTLALDVFVWACCTRKKRHLSRAVCFCRLTWEWYRTHYEIGVSNNLNVFQQLSPSMFPLNAAGRSSSKQVWMYLTFETITTKVVKNQGCCATPAGFHGWFSILCWSLLEKSRCGDHLR